MASDTWIDGSYVNSSGVWVQGKWLHDTTGGGIKMQMVLIQQTSGNRLMVNGITSIEMDICRLDGYN